MKLYKFLVFVLLIVLVRLTETASAQTIPQAFGFKLPLASYPLNDGCLEWQGVNSTFPGTYHAADDACVVEGTDVFASAKGLVRYARAHGTCPNWGHVVVIESQASDGPVCAIYGHVIPTVSEGTVVEQGEKIGDIGHYSCWSDHIHLGIRQGNYGAATGTYPSWLAGYVQVGRWPNGYVNPIPFVNSHPALVGYYTSGWLDTNHSQKFLDAYFADGTLGNPYDNGGGKLVHWWSDAGQYPLVGVWIQDFHNPATNQYSILVRNPNGRVFAVKGLFRDWYLNNQGYQALGAPVGIEHVVAPNYIQWFERGILFRPTAGGNTWPEFFVYATSYQGDPLDPYLLSATNFTVNSITLAWKDGRNPSGTTYKIYRNNAYVASSGTNLYFTDSGLSPNTMYQYKVSALYNNEESIFSNTVIVGTLPSEPSGQTGYLTLVSDPSGANIWRDGAFWKTTPVTNEVMDVGNYTMVAKKSGYGDTEFSFGVSPGYTTELNVRLNPTSFPYSIEAESMQGTGLQVTGGRKLVGADNWYIFENFNLPEAGRIEFEVIAKAEWQVNGYWPKLEVFGPVQEIPSTDYASYFYYADFSQIGQ